MERSLLRPTYPAATLGTGRLQAVSIEVLDGIVLPNDARMPTMVTPGEIKLSAPRIESARAAAMGVRGVKDLGWAPVQTEPVLYTGEFTDWLVRPLGEEEVELPPKAMRALDALWAAGVEFDRYLWAEELEKPELQKQMAPWSFTEVARAGGTAAVEAGTGLMLGAAFAGLVLAAPFALVASAALGAGAALSAVDPILIGVIEHPDDPRFGYHVEIARWAH
jgi:hypothetical protein